jgi:hypothetical protein
MMAKKTTRRGQRTGLGPAQQQTSIENSFPAVAEFVRTQGWIEIGDQQGIGFVARALDYGGLAYESKKPRTLGQAMKVLERGLARKVEQ